MVERIKAGDKQAFRFIIDRYRQSLYQTIYAILRNEKDAEDATQEAFIKIYLALPQYESQGFKTWMTRIAVNHAIDMKRKLRRQHDRDIHSAKDDVLSVQENIVTPLIRQERREMVRKRIKELPPHYRDIIIAYYIHEKSYKQLAQEWNVEVKTIETKLYRARNWIRKHWKEDDF